LDRADKVSCGHNYSILLGLLFGQVVSLFDSVLRTVDVSIEQKGQSK
jgi:hypothetical protein